MIERILAKLKYVFRLELSEIKVCLQAGINKSTLLKDKRSVYFCNKDPKEII